MLQNGGVNQPPRGLAAKMTSQARRPADLQPPAFSGVLKRLAAALLEARYAEVLPGELIYDGHAGPFLQALLTACSHDLCARSIVLLICCSLPLKILCALSPAARIVTHDLLTCRTLSAACLYAGSLAALHADSGCGA